MVLLPCLAQLVPWGHHSAESGMPGGGQESLKSILQLFLGRTHILGEILPGSMRSQHILFLT